MNTPQSLPHLYEDLANHYARRGESGQRDNCLVLAADAALAAELPEEAERLRRRLLLTNPHHLLRPFASMTEAMQSADVRDFVADLRKHLPPNALLKLLHQNAPDKNYPVAWPAPVRPAATAQAAVPAPAAPTVAMEPPADESPSALSYTLSLFVLILGLIFAGGVLFAALIWPLIE
jgi:hypothetical protein